MDLFLSEEGTSGNREGGLLTKKVAFGNQNGGLLSEKRNSGDKAKNGVTVGQEKKREKRG